MRICYVDEAGCTGALPSPTSNIQPLIVIAGVIVEQGRLRDLTLDLLHLKRRFFPGLSPTSRLFLDWMLVEVKGADMRRDAALGSRRERRHTVGFLDKFLELLEKHDVRIVGRLWIKEIGAPIDGTALYTSSIQAICTDFDHLLDQAGDDGIVIADSRRKWQNTRVSHSIFTRRFAAGHAAYANIDEMPTFGHSENHAGLQVADLLSSALLFPLAAYAYCDGHVRSIHIRPRYSALRARYGARLMRMQYRYQESGRWRGGITVSDPHEHRSGGHLFR